MFYRGNIHATVYSNIEYDSLYKTTSNHQLAYIIVSHSELGKLTPVVNYKRQHIVCEFLDIVCISMYMLYCIFYRQG